MASNCLASSLDSICSRGILSFGYNCFHLLHSLLRLSLCSKQHKNSTLIKKKHKTFIDDVLYSHRLKLLTSMDPYVHMPTPRKIRTRRMRQIIWDFWRQFLIFWNYLLCSILLLIVAARNLFRKYSCLYYILE